MEVLFYLKELLQDQKTIAIAGLGTFYKKKYPGKYDENKRSFLPPSYSLSFTKEVVETDELTNFIAVSENIDIEFAKLKIKEFTESIHNQLTNSQQAILSGLGKLVLVNNEIIFSTVENDHFGNEFYGLPTLSEIIEPKHKATDHVEKEIISVATEESLISDPKNELENINPENQPRFTGKPFTPNFDYDDDSNGETSKPIKVLLKTLLVITIIAVILGLAYFFKPEFFDNTLKDTTNEPINAETVILADSLAKEATLINADSINNANSDSALVLLKKEEPVQTNITTYEVIGSAERNQKRIDLVINSMKKKGIEAKALENTPGKLIKISLGSFTDFNLAKKYKDSLRKKLNNPEIYIQTINPKK